MKAGWTTKRLGEIATVSAGNSAPQDESLFQEGSVPFFRTSDAGRVRFGDIAVAEDLLNERGAKGLRRFPKGTILFPKSGASTFLNHRVILSVEGCVSSHLATIVVDEVVADPRFVLYYLSTVQAQDLVQDHAYPSLNLPLIAGIEIRLPPLPEQRRIVALLDEAFAGLATAAANAERNLDNARELFESHLAEVFSRRGDGWVERRLADVVSRLTNGYVGPTRGIYVDDGVPYLLARHVKDNTLKFDGRTFVTQAFNQRNKKSILKAGDVLLVQSGHIGHSAVVSPEHEGHNCHAMIVISPVLEIVSGEFLSLYFNSHEMRRRFDGIRSGSTVPHLTCGAVREELIPIPGHEAQRRIVEHARQFVFEARELSKSYSKKQAALAALKRSLLHQAFSGAL